MRKTAIQAAFVAFMVTATAGATSPAQQFVRVQSGWTQLTTDQREMIDLVASDIWSSERRGDVPFQNLPERKKSALREEAMDRLGFVMRPPRGVEA